MNRQIASRMLAAVLLVIAVLACTVSVASAAASRSETQGQCIARETARLLKEVDRKKWKTREARQEAVRQVYDEVKRLCPARPTTTTTTKPTTTTTAPPVTYPRTVRGLIAGGVQTVDANCDANDLVIDTSYEVGSPTGSNPDTPRFISVEGINNGQGARLTYEVSGGTNQRAILTIVCQRS